ncbi:hypothetical protein [Pumilibacter muris]|uniref:hypothetical protein n=1 Tax=Pumilibacter muris TaxID=2941510 RepID=UPI002041CB41|nr:hypothetical protein [Pumilibacter muris]
MAEKDEKVLCKIDCDSGHKKIRGDRVTVTEKRVYKTGINRFGREHKKVVSIDAVTCAEWCEERFERYLALGFSFFALCCVLSAYFLPDGKTLRFVLGIVFLALGAAAMILCTVAYFKFKIKTVTVYYYGGKMKIASPGISDGDAEEFIVQVLEAAERARECGRQKNCGGN